MNHRPAFSIADSSNLLRRTPGLLDTWLRSLPGDWLHANEGRDTFSAFGVIGHLIYGERSDWIGRARHIIEQREAAFEPFDRFGHQAEFKDVPLASLLDTFANLRAGNLDELRAFAITDTMLERQGIHPAFGTVTLRDCYPRGSCTTRATSRKSRACSPGATRPTWDRGARFCPSSRTAPETENGAGGANSTPGGQGQPRHQVENELPPPSRQPQGRVPRMPYL